MVTDNDFFVSDPLASCFRLEDWMKSDVILSDPEIHQTREVALKLNQKQIDNLDRIKSAIRPNNVFYSVEQWNEIETNLLEKIISKANLANDSLKIEEIRNSVVEEFPQLTRKTQNTIKSYSRGVEAVQRQVTFVEHPTYMPGKISDNSVLNNINRFDNMHDEKNYNSDVSRNNLIDSKNSVNDKINQTNDKKINNEIQGVCENAPMNKEVNANNRNWGNQNAVNNRNLNQGSVNQFSNNKT